MRDRNYSWEASAIRYRIGQDHILNTHANSISLGDKLIELEHRLVLLLIYFIHHKGEVLSKDQLLKTIWQGKVVNDDSLSVAVSHIRKALGDNPRAPKHPKRCLPVMMNPAPQTPHFVSPEKRHRGRLAPTGLPAVLTAC